MPPKAAEKKPSTGGKAPAGKAPAEKKEAGKKTATAASGDKKKRGKTRKETYSSYIYKGTWWTRHFVLNEKFSHSNNAI
jgi:histone H2B